MKKLYLIILISILNHQFTVSQEIKEIPVKKTNSGFVQFDFLSVKMPSDSLSIREKNMGFAGIHYNLMLNKWSYAGIGMYGAVTGIRGGFFTLGINAGIKTRLTNDLFIDTGLHFGGGGGSGAPDGGGAYILPHFNLGYQFNKFSLSGGWNYINFFDNGRIKGHQVNLALQIPVSFDYTTFKERENEFAVDDLKKTNWNESTRRLSIMFHLNNLKVKGISQYKGKTIRLAGLEINSYINKNWFFFIKADGAYYGIPAGYMDLFLGAGNLLSFNNNKTNILSQFGIGAGGGAGVETKGGFLIYPNVSIEQLLFDDFYISINKGYIMSPDSHFLSSAFGLGMKYNVDYNGTSSEEKSYASTKFKGIEVILKQDLYIHANRVNNERKAMHQFSFQISYYLNKHLYTAAQTSFANFGNAGAYAEGIFGFGVGFDPVLNNNLSLFIQILGGAGGGGGVSSGEGLIVKPSFGLKYSLNDTLNLRLASGYINAPNGKLSSPFVNFGVSYNFSFLKAN